MRERIPCHPRILAVALELINDFPLAGNLVVAIGHMPLGLRQIFRHEPPVHAGHDNRSRNSCTWVGRKTSNSPAGTRTGASRRRFARAGPVPPTLYTRALRPP